MISRDETNKGEFTTGEIVMQANGLLCLPRQDPGRRHREYKARIGSENGKATIYFRDKFASKQTGSDVQVGITVVDLLSFVGTHLGMNQGQLMDLVLEAVAFRE